MNEITRRGLIFGAATAAAYGVLTGVERVAFSAFAENAELEDDPGPVKIVKFADDSARLGIYSLAKVRKSESEWKKQLTPLQYDVTRRAATEFAFSGELCNQHAPGLYRCVDCNNASFDSRAKFDSGTGWRAFGKQSPRKMCVKKKISARACCERKSNARCATRIWAMSSQTDPSRPVLRYCMNSAALLFVSPKKLACATCLRNGCRSAHGCRRV